MQHGPASLCFTVLLHSQLRFQSTSPACRYNYNTIVMAASFRNVGEIRELAG